MKKQLKNKKQFTLIELIIVIVVIGILAAMALPKFIGVQRNAHVAAMETDLDVIEKAVMQYVMATDDGSYPFIDINGDTKINEEDLYFKTDTIPQTLTDTLLKANGDKGDKIYKLDMDKLKPYIDKLKYPNTEYVYSPNSDTAIDPIGKPDGDNNIHHIIGGGVIGNSIESGPLYDIYKTIGGYFYASKVDKTLTYYENNSSPKIGSFENIKDGEIFIGDNYVYRFRKDGTIQCLVGSSKYEIDITPLTNNGDKINLEKDLVQSSMNGFNLLCESGNVYHFRGSSVIYSTTKYKGELNPEKSKMYSCYSIYFTVQNEHSLYLFDGSDYIDKVYKIPIPGGITDKDQVLSAGIVNYVIKENGTIYHTYYHNQNELVTVNTSSIIGGIDTKTDTFINGGEKLFLLKKDGSLYRMNGDYPEDKQTVKINTDALSIKLDSNNIKTYVSNDYFNNCPMLIDSKNGKVFALDNETIREYDISFNESEDLIRTGHLNGLYLIKADGRVYRQYYGEMKLITNISDYMDFNSKKDAIAFNSWDSFSICKNNGDKYIFSIKNASGVYQTTFKKIN